MKSPIDADVRRRALEPDGSFIVQAPAGSGKTELLTRRVLTLLTTVDEPEQILAITFTRKAASEMRQRVMEILQQASTGVEPDSDHVAQGLALAESVLHRDQQQGWQLLRNPQRLNLRTIDSLATQLAHRLPVTSSLGSPIGMIENATRLYMEAAARFIEGNIDALDLVLLQLGNKLDRAQRLLADLLANRDQWKRHVYAAGEDHEQLRSALEGMLSELVESRLENLHSQLPLTLEERLLPRLKMAAQFCLDDAQGDVDGLRWEIQAWLNLDALPGTDLEDLNAWTAVAYALFTTSSGLRKKLTVKEGFPAKGDAKKRGVDVAVLVDHKAQMNTVLEQLADEPEFIQALKEVCTLPYPRYQDEQWALLSQLLEVLPDLLLELQLVFAEHAQVDFSEISERAQRALGTSDEPTDLALSMDLQIRHMLVDEFQDTSQTQFLLFRRLVEGWEPGDGRTFFAVGDPMQSIYRFREGDVALFTQAQLQGIGPVKLEPLTLSVNFRTTPVISHWVNETFATIFPSQADTNTGAVPYSPSDAFIDKEGSINIHPLIDASKDDEAVFVAELCQQAISRSSEHTVAILVRARSQAANIFLALRERQLSYQSIEMDLVGERSVVLDLIALCLALRYPHDRLHWLAVLRSPYVGLKLHDLYTLMHDAPNSATVFHLLQRADRVEKMSEDARQRITRLLRIITPAVDRARRDRLIPWVESIWLQLGGPVICKDLISLDSAERAFAALIELEAMGQLQRKSDIDAAMAKLFVASSELENCQIQVMTLHKAKGLEFDTVIVPALDRQSASDSAQLLNWFEGNLDSKPQLLLAPFEQAGLHPNQRGRLNKMVRRARERCDEQEKNRLLYVACTRARQHLHLVAIASHGKDEQLKAPKNASLLHPLWPLFESWFDQAAQEQQQSAEAVKRAESLEPVQEDLLGTLPAGKESNRASSCEQDTAIELPAFRRIPIDCSIPRLSRFEWQSTPTKSADNSMTADSPVFFWVGREARAIGTAIHHHLQLLANIDVLPDTLPKAEIEPVVHRQLRNLGFRQNTLEKASATVIRALESTLSDSRGRWILDSHSQARSEWALTATIDLDEGQHRTSQVSPILQNRRIQSVIIDRTFVDDDGLRWIVDYKTSNAKGLEADAFMDKEQQQYADQLHRYTDIIRRLEERTIRVGLYFPLIQGWREWAPD